MRNPSRPFLRHGAALAAALLVSACGGGEAPGRGGGFGGAGPVAVIASEVRARTYTDRITALGTARASESIDVTSRIASVVERIAFEEGQQVAAGDLLVALDDDEIGAELARARAQLKQAESQFARSKALAATRVVSAAELEQQEAGVLAARADVRAAEARLRHTAIRAPFAGTVGLRRISPGDLVGPDTLITTLDDTRRIKLEFTVPESFLARLAQGMDIEARSDVYPDRAFAGKVASIDTRIDTVTRSVSVVAGIDNPDATLKPGMFMTVELAQERRDVLMVPEEALVPRQGRQFVYVIEDGKAVERQVQLGGRAPGLAEIRTGLAAGDLLITEGTQKVRDGAPVTVTAATG